MGPRGGGGGDEGGGGRDWPSVKTGAPRLALEKYLPIGKGRLSNSPIGAGYIASRQPSLVGQDGTVLLSEGAGNDGVTCLSARCEKIDLGWEDRVWASRVSSARPGRRVRSRHLLWAKQSWGTVCRGGREKVPGWRTRVPRASQHGECGHRFTCSGPCLHMGRKRRQPCLTHLNIHSALGSDAVSGG